MHHSVKRLIYSHLKQLNLTFFLFDVVEHMSFGPFFI